MDFSTELKNLLAQQLPRMTAEGEQRFRELMEQAVAGAVRQAFGDYELNAFHVTKMTV